MNLRFLLVTIVSVVSMLLPYPPLAAQPTRSEQLPSFRSGVELVLVDVGVVDRRGDPIPGLAPADFVVKVDGHPRRVVTAEYVDVESAPSDSSAAPDQARVSTNEGGGVGRLFVFLVDNNTLETGDARRVTAAAAPFFARLSFADRSALLALPVGRSIAFTWKHDSVREELQRTAATGGVASTWEYGSLTEARDIATRGPLALREVIERECSTALAAAAQSSSSGSAPSGQGSQTGGGQRPGTPRVGTGSREADQCVRDIQAGAEMTWSMARANSLSSVTALRHVLAALAGVPGDKTVVLISGGWPLEDHEQTSILRSVAAEASTARARFFTVFVPRATLSMSRRSSSSTPLSDRDLHASPLETLAHMTGGQPFKADAAPEAMFDRLARGLAGYYRIGVEKNASDAGASGRPMDVQVARSGAIVRAREIFDISTYEDRNWSARLGSALSSPIPATALGLRMTSYLAPDPDDPSYLRLVLAGDASRLQPGEALVQFVVRDLEGRNVTGGDQRLREPKEGTAAFAVNVRVPHGSYVVRLAVMDGTGRVGSVDHRVEARPVSLGKISVTGPLLVQLPPSKGAQPRFALDGMHHDERLALEVGIEGEQSFLSDVDVAFEIAKTPDGPALIQQPADVSREGRRDGSVLAQAVADVRELPPGQYFARVAVRAGGQPLGRVQRAFAILESPSPQENAPHQSPR